MTDSELIAQIKLIYGSDIGDAYSDEELSAFLNLAVTEIIKWQYRFASEPDEVDTSEYDTVKVMAVIVGLTQHGAEGEGDQTEGSFRRTFSYPTMLEYIHRHVIPYVGTGR